MNIFFTKENKYKNKKIEEDGQVFDSVREYRRWHELILLQRAGEIRDLCRQVPFVLIPSQKTIEGKVVRPVVYKADFAYRTKKGRYVVEDVKGVKTKDYIIKWKLMLYMHNIQVEEVY